MPTDTRKPRGRASDWTEEQLDEMTSQEAMQKAQPDAAEFWRESAPDQFSDLLDAMPMEVIDAAE